MNLSIIIPFYNAAPSLKDTVNSIQKQTFSDIEIILIDDGSTDNGYVTAYTIAKEDHRIQIYQQENNGVSSARNLGITKAQGEYVTFVDADDLVSKTMYEELMNEILESDVDVCISGMQRNGVSVNDLPEGTRLVEGNEDIQSKIVGNLLGSPGNKFIIGPSVCRMIIRRKLLLENSIYFDTRISYHEDFVFLIELFLHASNAYIDPRPFYNYFYNKAEHNTRHKLKIVESEKHVVHFLEDIKNRTIIAIEKNINIGIIRSITLACETTCDLHSNSIYNQVDSLKQIYSECNLSVNNYFHHKNLSLKQKILFWLFSHRLFIQIIILCKLVRTKSSWKKQLTQIQVSSILNI